MTQIIAPAKKVDGNCYACMFVVKAMYETQRDGKLKQVPFKIDNWKNSTDRSWYIRLDKEPEGLVSVCYDDSMGSYPTRLIFATSNSAGIFTAPGEYVNIFHKMVDSDVAIAVEPKLRLSATEFQLPSWVWGNAYIEPKNAFTAKRSSTTLADAEQVNPGIWTAPKGVTRPILRVFNRMHRSNDLQEVPFIKTGTIEGRNVFFVPSHIECGQLVVEYDTTFATGSTNINSNKPACPPAPEPTFVLRAQDATAPAAIELWIAMNSVSLGTSHPKIRSARAVINAMLAWPKHKLPD